MLQLQLRGGCGFRPTKVYDPRTRASRDGVFVETSDGSQAAVVTDTELDGQRPVLQTGPRRLWDSVETAYQLWCHLGQPDPGRFGVVANPTIQFIWLDTDESWYR
ncbi:MAG: hypothetical protein ACRDSL_18695 [Pseudonocardiaceae bacterium]